MTLITVIKNSLPFKIKLYLKQNHKIMQIYMYLADRSLLRYIHKKTFKLAVDLKLLPFRAGVNKNIKRNHSVSCSLTSYGRRVYLVHYTIASLLMQSNKPDSVVLWLDDGNWNNENIPNTLRRLCQYGLDIRFCADIKSYKKLVPMIEHEPNSVIVTADDDMYYPRKWLKLLIEAYEKRPEYVICYRADKIKLAESGEVLPYCYWDLDTKDENPSHLIMPVGCLGILYPPGVMHRDTNDRDTFMSLSPHSDDIWFWAMSVRNDVKKAIIRQRGLYNKQKRPSTYEIYDTCQDKLANHNVLKNGNDLAMSAVVSQFELLQWLKL